MYCSSNNWLHNFYIIIYSLRVFTRIIVTAQIVYSQKLVWWMPIENSDHLVIIVDIALKSQYQANQLLVKMMILKMADWDPIRNIRCSVKFFLSLISRHWSMSVYQNSVTSLSPMILYELCCCYCSKAVNIPLIQLS